MIEKYLRPLLFITVGAVLIFLFLLVFNIFLNYGTISIKEVQAGSSITVNGKVVESSTKVRPGEYSVRVTNKDLSTYYQSVVVDRFKTVIVTPTQNKQNTKEIIAGALGFDPKNITDTDIRDVKTFENGTTIAGSLSQGTYALFVIEYRNGWKPIYYNAGGYQSLIDLVPNQDVRNYINDLDARYKKNVQ